MENTEPRIPGHESAPAAGSESAFAAPEGRAATEGVSPAVAASAVGGAAVGASAGEAFEVEVGRFFLAPSVPPIVQQMSR